MKRKKWLRKKGGRDSWVFDEDGGKLKTLLMHISCLNLYIVEFVFGLVVATRWTSQYFVIQMELWHHSPAPKEWKEDLVGLGWNSKPTTFNLEQQQLFQLRRVRNFRFRFPADFSRSFVLGFRTGRLMSNNSSINVICFSFTIHLSKKEEENHLCTEVFLRLKWQGVTGVEFLLAEKHGCDYYPKC